MREIGAFRPHTGQPCPGLIACNLQKFLKSRFSGKEIENSQPRLSRACKRLESFCLTSHPQGRFSWSYRNEAAEWVMEKIKSPRPVRQPPLEAGQLWRMAEANLQVVMVGKLLVHYKLGKHGAVRVPHSCNCIKTIEKFLKSKKALLT